MGMVPPPSTSWLTDPDHGRSQSGNSRGRPGREHPGGVDGPDENDRREKKGRWDRGGMVRTDGCSLWPDHPDFYDRE